ncbi:hypothetical protein OG588_13770 [Streptomyces prunicolor]|uniref:hypothetical protein n=1 Tax=Streptomyces prunicolor TaxID=67348 RepID=UPI0038654A4A|nr:hypothetical protein OG588_13770 [Streptomyces prunicolor]
MFETVLTILTIVFQVVGLILAAVGLLNTFKDSSASGDRFFARVLVTELGVVRQLWAGLKSLCRRLFGRPRSTVTHALGAALEISAAVSAQGTVQFGPLPDPAQDPDAFKAAVEDRLNRVHNLAQDVQYNLGQEAKAREKEDQKIGSDFQSRIAALDEESKQATIRGLHEQVLGLFCVAAGLAVQSILDLYF